MVESFVNIIIFIEVCVFVEVCVYLFKKSKFYILFIRYLMCFNEVFLKFNLFILGM